MLIGIDLGTTNSLVACFRNGKAELIPNSLGQLLTPSVVSIDSEGSVYVGSSAKERALLHPEESASVFKRSMGTDREFSLGKHKLRAEELSSLILRSLKEDAQKYLGEPVTDAIISVPAYFNDLQRKATKRAGELAGLNVVRMINEPTAAALAHGMGEEGNCTYLIFDLGGGTFDVSVLELDAPIMEVHAIAGDNFIGGEDFTDILLRLFLERTGLYKEVLDPRTMTELRKIAEHCKCTFSYSPETLMCCNVNGKLHAMNLSIEEYEKACEPLLERLRKPIERSLRDAKLRLRDIDKVVLVGGGTKSPVIRRFVERLFQRAPDQRTDPDKAIAIGAALQCGIKNREEQIREIVLTDVCPFTLGTEVIVGEGMYAVDGHYLPIIERNTVIPVSRTETVCTSHDNQSRITVKILQGESRMAQNNLLLGELSVPVPPGEQGKEKADITFTYDINSLLEVEVTVRSTGLKRKMLIRGNSCNLTEQEAEERMEALHHLKLNPGEEEPNRLLLLRGERMYEEATMEKRHKIDRAVTAFEQALNKGDRAEISRQRDILKQTLDRIEQDPDY